MRDRLPPPCTSHRPSTFSPEIPIAVRVAVVINWLVLSLFAYLEFKDYSPWLLLFAWVALAFVSFLLSKQ
jgi:hypothetical protein